jgi:predicted transcriptional regulator
MKTKKKQWSDFVDEEMEIPDGFETADQIRQKMNRSTSRTNFILKKLIAADAVEVKKFKIKGSSGFYWAPHYRLK